MKIGVVGLGLIGGSLAKAFMLAGGMVVYGSDIDASIQEFARISGATHGALLPERLGECECILLAVTPDAAAAWLEENAGLLAPGTLVMDCCGTKRRICEVGFRLAERFGFEFAGGHPMAGSHQWGFKNSRAELFKGACFVVVPRTFDDINLLERIKRCIMPAGFGSVSVTTAEQHDKLIAFTSQLAHVVSNAYIKSPTALMHRGFSAGSYQDLTRVAWLNPGMWTQLFLDNRDNLIPEIDTITAALGQYRSALAEGDSGRLHALLSEGRLRKEEVDGK